SPCTQMPQQLHIATSSPLSTTIPIAAWAIQSLQNAVKLIAIVGVLLEFSKTYLDGPIIEELRFDYMGRKSGSGRADGPNYSRSGSFRQLSAWRASSEISTP